jgi:tRNA (mo5U34)-methyltransferase
MARLSTDELREEIIRLGPWHHDIDVRDGITTRVSEGTRYRGRGQVQMLNWKPEFTRRMKRVYPDGFEGRSVMDCSCNCGECLFWAKELGAGRCFGSDVREHWINQARFLLEHREGPKDEIEIRVCDLYDLPELGLEPFDVGLFHGVYYHLPDPIRGLQIAAEMTKELLAVTTSTAAGLDDGVLKVGEESKTGVLSGVYGLHWLPSGPKVIERQLEWMGFPHTRVTFWRRKTRRNRGRLSMLAAREEETFAAFDADAANRAERKAEETATA